MSYYVEGADSQGRGFCNLARIVRVREMGNLPASVARFIDSGVIETEAERDRVIADTKGRPGLDFIATALDGLKAPIGLSDGANSIPDRQEDE